MIITGGLLKGRRISTIKATHLRPTSSLVRESIFNIIGYTNIQPGITFLDLFGGSGLVSFEAISRGITQVTIVEKDTKKSVFIKKNAEDLGIINHLTICCMDATKFLSSQNKPYDYIFIDPPYASVRTLVPQLLEIILQSHLLTENGWVMIEHSKNDRIHPLPPLIIHKSKKYGDTLVTILKAE